MYDGLQKPLFRLHNKKCGNVFLIKSSSNGSWQTDIYRKKHKHPFQIKTKWEKPMEKNSCLRHPVWNDIFIGFQMVGSLCSYKVMLVALRKIRDSCYHSVPFLSTGWLVCGSYRYRIHAQLLTVKTGIGVNSAIEGINSKGLVMSVGVWN